MIMHRVLYRQIRGLLLFGLLLLAAPALATGQKSILVLGDSISAAYGMSLNQGWVELMANELAHSHPQYQVVNASISGETSAGGLRRLPGLLQAHAPELVIIELGGNDGLRGHPIDLLRTNLQQLASLSRNAGAAVLLLPMDIPPNYGARYTEAFRESFIISAERTGAALGPWLIREIGTQPHLMQPDGIHPTAEAQPLIARAILPAVTSLLE